MRKTIISLTSAAALAAAGVVVPLQRAQAHPAWVVPVIIAAALGGVVLGVGVSRANSGPIAYYPGDPRYDNANAVETRDCGWRRIRVHGVLKRVPAC